MTDKEQMMESNHTTNESNPTNLKSKKRAIPE